jgi:hypothetical protein
MEKGLPGKTGFKNAGFKVSGLQGFKVAVAK